MRSRLASLEAHARNLRYSYLFLPGLLALAFTGLALGLTAAERVAGSPGSTPLFPAGPDAARSALSTIAASLITVAGVTFSITIISLQLVSQQFTPRALRNFLGDRLNQTVAGVFIGVFLYCLLVLRVVETGRDPFLPAVSITLGFVLAFVALGLLLVFIHHMAHSIQVSNIADDVAQKTLAAAETIYPAEYGEEADEEADALVARWRAEEDPVHVHPPRPGFVQSVDDVPTTIGGRAFRVQLLVAPGDFVTERHPLAAVWPSGDPDECAEALRRAIVVTGERDIEQDLGYGVRQLADIAIKAMSPSVNDPTTATTCIGYLQAILERLTERPWPARVRLFPDQEVTLVMKRDDFADYLESLVQIGRYATSDARVVRALLRATRRVAQAAAAAGRTAWAADAVAHGERIAARAAAGGSLDETEREVLERDLAELRALAPEGAAARS